MAGIGHNSGRADEPGQSWRRFAWAKARRDLMPTLPIEVVRMRVKRAAELGLPYKTYAGIRASSGHDLIGFMFSNNALDVLRRDQAVAATKLEKLAQLQHAITVGLAHRPVDPASLVPPLQAAFAAPGLMLNWSQTRDTLKSVARAMGQPADRFVIVAETALEREWAEIMQAAGTISGASFFATA